MYKSSLESLRHDIGDYTLMMYLLVTVMRHIFKVTFTTLTVIVLKMRRSVSGFKQTKFNFY